MEKFDYSKVGLLFCCNNQNSLNYSCSADTKLHLHDVYLFNWWSTWTSERRNSIVFKRQAPRVNNDVDVQNWFCTQFFIIPLIEIVSCTMRSLWYLMYPSISLIDYVSSLSWIHLLYKQPKSRETDIVYVIDCKVDRDTESARVIEKHAVCIFVYVR